MTGLATALKALNDSGRVGGYLVVWGSSSQKDLQGEYFTPDTDLALGWYAQRPALYHHGLDGTMKADTIGVIDTLRPDETGLWAEAQLDTRKRYVQAVLNLINKGALGWSSGSLPHLVEVAQDGQIKRWPIVEGSMTPTPAEPRHTDINAIKSAYTELNLDFTRLLPDATTGNTDAEELTAIELAVKADTGDGLPPENTNPPTEVQNNTMDVNAILQALLQAMSAQFPDLQVTPEQATAIVQSATEALSAGAQASAEGATLAAPAVIAQATPIIGKALLDLAAAKAANVQVTQQQITAAATKFMQTAPPISRVPAFTTTPNANGAGSGVTLTEARPNPQIEQRTKFANLDAEDMSYLYDMRRKFRVATGKWAMDADDESKFMRELADKAGKAYSEGKLSLGEKEEAARALKSINFMKSNEINTSTQSSYGDEWVPDLWSANVWDRARLDNVILPLFQVVEMPSDPYELPVESTDPTVSLVPETANESALTLASSSSPIPDSKVGSGKVTLSSKKLALRVGVSQELIEDSIIPIVAMYRKQSQRAMQDSVDNVLLNGDNDATINTNINKIDGTPASTDKYLAFNGLRKLPLITTTANKVDGGGVAITLAQLRQARFTLDRAYSANPDNLAIITHSEAYAKMLGLTEFITMDKAGALATAMKGQIGVADGMKVLVSNEFALTDSAGKIPVAGGTLGSFVIVYTPGWYVGYRRKINVVMSYLDYYDSYQLTATVRLAFINRDGEVAAAVYNSLV